MIQSESSFRQDSFRVIRRIGIHHHDHFGIGPLQIAVQIPIWKTAQAELDLPGAGVHTGDFPAKPNHKWGFIGVLQGPEHGFTHRLFIDQDDQSQWVHLQQQHQQPPRVREVGQRVGESDHNRREGKQPKAGVRP